MKSKYRYWEHGDAAYEERPLIMHRQSKHLGEEDDSPAFGAGLRIQVFGPTLEACEEGMARLRRAVAALDLWAKSGAISTAEFLTSSLFDGDGDDD